MLKVVEKICQFSLCKASDKQQTYFLLLIKRIFQGLHVVILLPFFVTSEVFNYISYLYFQTLKLYNARKKVAFKSAVLKARCQEKLLKK